MITPLVTDGAAPLHTGDISPFDHRPLCYVLDEHAPVRKIVSFSAARKNIRCVEFVNVGSLILHVLQESADLLFIDIEFADMDAVELMRCLEEVRFGGIVHFMSRREPALLGLLVQIGLRRGLRMGSWLLKPFRRAAVEDLIDRDLSPSPDSPPTGISVPAAVPAVATLQAWLGETLDPDDVEICYQPRFDLRSGRAIGAEAFFRRKGTSDRFPALNTLSAEPAVLDRLAMLMFTTVMADWKRLSRPSIKPLIALRIPLDCLARLPIGELIRGGRPQEADWPGMVLELTEREILKDRVKGREVAAQLKIHGLKVSISDFGTGHTALAELEPIGPSQINISRVFVANVSCNAFNAKICETIIFLSRSLGARTIAKGIESEADLATLIELECEAGQGEFLSPPRSLHDFERFLAEGAIVRLPATRPARLSAFIEAEARLSQREVEVLELIASGKSSKETATVLGLSPRTVDVHRSKLLAKLKAKNAAELVLRAMTPPHR